MARQEFRGRVGPRPIVPAFAAAIAVSLSICAPAFSQHDFTEQVSVGANGFYESFFAGASEDGTRAFFETAEPIAPGDNDTNCTGGAPGSRCIDVYERAGGTTTLVSTGPATSGNGGFHATFKHASADGSRVLFETREPLVASDTDGSQTDVYERVGTTTTLISTGSTSANPSDASFAGASRDGTRVFFRTGEGLVAGDTDGGAIDLYERTGAATTLVSTGPAGPNGNFAVEFVAASADGSRVFFVTREPLVASDTDSCEEFQAPSGCEDLYERSSGGTELISTGPTAGGAELRVTDADISEDGAHAVFRTQEQLVASDTDARFDAYVRTGGVTSLVSIGPLGGNGNFDVPLARLSRDGSRIFFTTVERLESADFDASVDVYEHSGGNTNLVSPAPVSGGHGNVSFGGASYDGTHVYIVTPERLAAEDEDIDNDVYERLSGQTALISKGPLSLVGGRYPAVFRGASEDGTRVFFTTDEALTAQDYSSFDSDIYERFAGTTTLVSTGGGDNGGRSAFFKGLTPNGSRVFFETSASFPPDADLEKQDAFAAVIRYPRLASAPRVKTTLVPAFAPCASPNREHGPPLAHGSCAPPVPASSNLTVGGAGAAAAAVGSVRLRALVGMSGPPNDSDLKIDASISDVRCQAGASPCGPANAAGGDDYVGELQGSVGVRITDRFNGHVPTDSATVQDDTVTFPLSCTSTPSDALGGACVASTSANALVPGIVREGDRAIWQLGQVRIFDGGSDGDADTAPNALFAVQGLFVP